MVRQGDFAVELVEANSKTPFKEHDHEGKTYVEVEPEQEYFIAISKPGNDKFSGVQKATFHVDGQNLASDLLYKACTKSDSPSFHGTRKCKKNESHCTLYALKFVVPNMASARSGSDGHPCGRVDVKIFQGINPRISEGIESEPVTIESSAPVLASRTPKTVRSSNGTSQAKGIMSKFEYVCGDLLETITLYYSTTPGLVEMGVIPGRGARGTVKVKDEAKMEAQKRKRVMESQPTTSSQDNSSDDDDDDNSVVATGPAPKAIWTVDLTAFASDSEEDTQPVAKPRHH